MDEFYTEHNDDRAYHAVEDLAAWYIQVTGVPLSEVTEAHLRDVLVEAKKQYDLDTDDAAKALIAYCSYLDNAQDTFDPNADVLGLLASYAGAWEDVEDYLRSAYSEHPLVKELALDEPVWDLLQEPLDDEGFLFVSSPDERLTHIFRPAE